jgi:hypothetical protein
MILVLELGALCGEEAHFWLDVMSAGHPTTNGRLSALCERFGIYVLGDQTWHVTIVAGDMLLTHFMLVTGNPSGCVAAAVTEHVLEGLILGSHILQRYVAVQTHCGGLG